MIEKIGEEELAPCPCSEQREALVELLDELVFRVFVIIEAMDAGI